MGLVSRALGRLGYTKGHEGGGPYFLPVSGGWLSAEAGRHVNWWQMGHDLQAPDRSAMVEACVSAYAQTVAMCPGNHWRWTEEGGRKRVTNSALTRVLRKPNAYQTISDLLLNVTRSLFTDGNAYGLALRNDRFEVAEIHLMSSASSGAQVAQTGEIFYHLTGNEVIERQLGLSNLVVPARDVLHIRLHTPRHPLVGDTPLAAAGLQMAAGNSALSQQINFFLNQSRPSFVLSTDKQLTPEQVQQLRTSWDQQAKGLNQGGTPILSSGLKPQEIGRTAEQSQLAEMLGLSDQAIANVLRVPLPVLGLGGQTFASTEALMQFWLASGLGFVLNHIEEAMGGLFKLAGQPDEYLELDTSALQRSAFKDRVEGWARGVQTALFSPNEGRREFELPPVEDGDEPRVQQQVVPLSFWGDQPPAAPTPPPAPDAEPEGDDEQPNADEIAEAAARILLPDIQSGFAALQDRFANAPKQLCAEDVEEIVLRALPPPPAELPPPAPTEDECAAFAGMALLKEMEEIADFVELPPPPAASHSVVKSEPPQINITVENHIPRKGAERTTVTKHDDRGRISEFVREEVEE